MQETIIAGSTLYKKYRDHQSFKPKIITVTSRGITSKVIENQVFKSSQAAKDYAEIVIKKKYDI
jgi:hypothetical protein